MNVSMSRRAFVALGATAALTASFGMAGCGAGGIGGSKPVCEVGGKRAFTAATYDKSLLVLDLDVKNNSEHSIPPDMIGYAWCTATQDGKRLAEGYAPGDVPGVVQGGASIPAGGEGQAQVVFELAGEGPVEVVVTPDTVDGKSAVEVYRESFDLSSVEKVESESTFDVSIDDVRVTDDGEGKGLVVIAVTFTNDADAPVSFGTAVETSLYQNGVALKEGYLPYSHPLRDTDLESNAYTDVKKGASLPVQVTFELIDDAAPVEVSLADRMSFDRRVVMEKTIDVSGGAPAADAGAKA